MPIERTQWGTTPPISVAGPTEQDILHNKGLIDELKRQGSFEPTETSQLREKVLTELQKMVEEFVAKVGVQRHLSQQMAKDAGGKIFTFGSYRLGVYGPGSDIDTLMVVPRHVLREDLFTTFEPMLRARSGITDITAVPNAYVPVLKFKFHGISIDLLIARLALSQIKPDLELMDNNLLRNISDQCIKSLNGTRVTDQILQLVPNPAVFKHTLRCIKLWAQRRAIYANVFGFPGGVAWAMLVARICQLYPKAVSSTIIAKFFRILSQWNWPQPILLKQIEEGPLQVKTWNPKIYPQDRAHRMPIITPAHPSMCATHNITASTQTIILREMARAGDIADNILTGKTPWSELFKKYEFFNQYKYYLCVIAASRKLEQHLQWEGLVESKIRQLVMKLEILERITLAHPYLKRYEETWDFETEEDAQNIAGGKKFEGKCEQVENGREVKLGDTEPENRLYVTKWFVGIDVDMKGSAGDKSKRLDISWPAQEFYDQVKRWDQYDEKILSLCIKFVKNYDLTDSVFEPGEARPMRPQKEKKRPHSEKEDRLPSSEQSEKKQKVDVQKQIETAAS